jgi:hypothetical protein
VPLLGVGNTYEGKTLELAIKELKTIIKLKK